MQDKFRVFHNGAGSYDVVAPKIKELLQRHRSRPIGARVTLTSGRAGRHADLPAPDRGDRVLGGRLRAGDDGAEPRLRDCRRGLRRDARRSSATSPYEFLEACGRRTGITASRTSRRRSRRFTRASARRIPCGAGLGLLGVVDRRRRRAVPPLRRLGRAQARHGARRHRPRRRRRRSSRSTTSTNKTDCSTCWARPLCSGGCYHEAHTRYGETDAAEPALLRMDPRLDRRLPADLRRAGRAQSRRSSRSSTTNARLKEPVS